MTVGSKVSWSSQANGSVTTKEGIVIAVIPPLGRLRDHLSGLQWEYFRNRGNGVPRLHESYIVHIPPLRNSGNGKLYWPHASKLKEIQ